MSLLCNFSVGTSSGRLLPLSLSLSLSPVIVRCSSACGCILELGASTKVTILRAGIACAASKPEYAFKNSNANESQHNKRNKNKEDKENTFIKYRLNMKQDYYYYERGIELTYEQFIFIYPYFNYFP